jgi:hypothetical protein
LTANQSRTLCCLRNRNSFSAVESKANAEISGVWVVVCLFAEGEFMSKSKNHKASSSLAQRLKDTDSKKRMLMLTTIFTIILLTGGVFGQWTGIFSISQKSQSKVGELSPASFNTNAPAKEYVYAGGKPIVTIEPQTACTYALSATSLSFRSDSGTGQVMVTTTGGSCPWTASSNDAWIIVTSGTPGNGNGSVQFSFSANTTGMPRIGTLTIAGQPFSLYQGIAFNDVAIGAPFYDEIGKLSARSVTLGCSEIPRLYCPGQLVTREQMAAFIIRAVGELNPPIPPTQRFNDVPDTNPFYKFIDRMAVLQITVGCQTSPPLYCPSNTVTHQEMAAFIIRALGMSIPPTPATQQFSDVPPSNPFYAFIDQMYERGIWTGCPGSNTYCPTSQVTREQMAAILVRAFNL